MIKKEQLDASAFKYVANYYQLQLKAILKECIGIYKLIISSHQQLPNKENVIRDAFMQYLKSDSYKNSHSPLDKYHFEKEVDEGKGRIDIKILNVSPYNGEKIYYIIECKRLNNKNLLGKNGLNAEYIKNGICRFTTNYYSTNLSCNAMFGFIVEPINIDWNVKCNINSMLKQDFIDKQGEKVNANPLQNITNLYLTEDSPYSYYSIHRLAGNNKNITLYHIMFDFSMYTHPK